jgi:hypothetical protein
MVAVKAAERLGRLSGKLVRGGIRKNRNSTPKNLNIHRNRPAEIAVRGSPGHPAQNEDANMLDNSPAGGEAGNVNGNNDAERFAITAALMAKLGDEINEYGSAIHNELQRQMAEANFQGASQTIRDHLGSLVWSSPANSPHSASSSQGTPKSATSETRRDRFIGRELRNKEFNSLLQSDVDFHNLMTDLNGLREWWSTNRAEWIQQRDAILAMEENINALIRRQGAATAAEGERIQSILELDFKELTSQLDWFPRNERLQRRVKAQFRNIAARTAILEGHIAPLRVVKEWTGPKELAFDWPANVPQGFQDINAAAWWQRLSNEAAGHLRFCIDSFGSHIRSIDSRIEDCNTTITLTPSEITQIERDAPLEDHRLTQEVEDFRTQLSGWLQLEGIDQGYWNKELQSKIDRRNRAPEVRHQLIAEKEDLLRVLNDEVYKLRIDRADFIRRKERDVHLLELLEALPRVPSFEIILQQGQLANQLFEVFNSQFIYENLRTAISKLQNNTRFQKSYRDRLLKLLAEDQVLQSDLHKELIQTVKETIVMIQRGGNFETDWANRLFINMRELVDSAAEIDRISRGLNETRRRELLLGLLGAIEIGEPSGLRPALDTAVPFQWGKGLSIQEANEIADEGLEVMDRAERQNVIDALRQFFVSPDIAPTFEHTNNMSKLDFLQLVNTFVVTPITQRQMEAFLTICHDDGDLFTITMLGKVSVYDQGWELLIEMPIRGPARSVRIPEPPGIDRHQLEEWLASPATARRLGIFFGSRDPTSRLFSEPELVNNIQALHGPNRNTHPNMIKNALRCFIWSGKFYKLLVSFISHVQSVSGG